MSIVIVAAGAAWLFAQLIKVLSGLIKYGHDDSSRILWRVLWAGGMPSAHSALITATTFVIFLTSGSQSSLFGLSLVMSCIVVYDRSRAFSIYDTFQEKYPELKKTVQDDPVLKDLIGHKFSEIVTGSIIGLFTGLLVYFCY